VYKECVYVCACAHAYTCACAHAYKYVKICWLRMGGPTKNQKKSKKINPKKKSGKNNKSVWTLRLRVSLLSSKKLLFCCCRYILSSCSTQRGDLAGARDAAGGVNRLPHESGPVVGCGDDPHCLQRGAKPSKVECLHVCVVCVLS